MAEKKERILTLREKHSRTTLRATENFPACLAFFSAPAARPAIRTGFFMDLPGLSVSVSVSRAYPFHAATLLAPPLGRLKSQLAASELTRMKSKSQS